MKLYRHSNLSLDQHQDILGKFAVKLYQLSPGWGKCDSTILKLDGCSLVRGDIGASMMIAGSVPDEVGFVFPLKEFSFYAFGKTFPWESQLATVGAKEVVLLVPENSDKLLVSFSYDLILSALGQKDCERPRETARRSGSVLLM